MYKEENNSENLIIANKELAFQNKEKEKRAAELIIANKELVYQNKEKEKRAAELIIANKELAYQNDEKEKRAAELIIVNNEYIEIANILRMRNHDLEQFAQIVSHKLRGPIASILGATDLFSAVKLSLEEKAVLVDGIIISATELDEVIKDLNQVLQGK